MYDWLERTSIDPFHYLTILALVVLIATLFDTDFDDWNHLDPLQKSRLFTALVGAIVFLIISLAKIAL